jgi:hypothetical protein
MKPSPEGLRASSLDLFEAACELREYQVAYHALAAVLHAAERLEDAATCERIERHANECREWIDANEPRHKLSSQSAQNRGHESVFRQLAVTAVAARLRIESDIMKRKLKGRPKAPS